MGRARRPVHQHRPRHRDEPAPQARRPARRRDRHRHRATDVILSMHLPRPSIRLRLTAWYATIFMAMGTCCCAALLRRRAPRVPRAKRARCTSPSRRSAAPAATGASRDAAACTSRRASRPETAAPVRPPRRRRRASPTRRRATPTRSRSRAANNRALRHVLLWLRRRAAAADARLGLRPAGWSAGRALRPIVADHRDGAVDLRPHARRAHRAGGPARRAARAGRHLRLDARPAGERVREPAPLRRQRVARAAHAAGHRADRARRHARGPERLDRRAARDGRAWCATPTRAWSG